MYLRSLICVCLVTVAIAAHVKYTSEEGSEEALAESSKDYYDPPHYVYEYAVDDKKNGVLKSHRESRSGGTVKGEYSVLEAGGMVRTVTYTADDINGFQAVVTRHRLQSSKDPVVSSLSLPRDSHQQPSAVI